MGMAQDGVRLIGGWVGLEYGGKIRLEGGPYNFFNQRKKTVMERSIFDGESKLQKIFENAEAGYSITKLQGPSLGLTVKSTLGVNILTQKIEWCELSYQTYIMLTKEQQRRVKGWSQNKKEKFVEHTIKELQTLLLLSSQQAHADELLQVKVLFSQNRLKVNRKYLSIVTTEENLKLFKLQMEGYLPTWRSSILNIL